MPALAEDDKNILSQQNYNTIEVNENNLRNNQNQQTNENKYNFVHSVGVLFGVSYGGKISFTFYNYKYKYNPLSVNNC